MGLWDAITDAVSDAAESAYDAVAQGAIGDVIATAATAVDTASFGMAGRALHATDDYVFDTVDFVTAGAVNVDFDDGQFTVGTGIEGVAHVGASIGEAGITANGEALIGGGFDLRMTDEGFLASGSAGIDWGPLPYAEGHVQLDANGDVKVNGHVQGTLPTPYGIFSGEASGGFASTADSWGVYLDSNGTWQTPTGITLGAGEHFAYEETADGSHLSVGVDGSVSYMGMGKVSGGVDYERLEHDGDVVQGVHVEGEVDALGMSAGAEADYRHADVGGVETSDWSGDADFDGPSVTSVVHTVGTIAASELGGDDALGSTAAADLAPMTEFDTAIDAADSVEQSMDDLMQDLS